jgi:hypothetical protein
MRSWLFLIVSFLFTACSWFHSEKVVIRAHGISFGEKYYSARLIEKLKTVDGPSIKDTSVVLTLKSALTEELLVEAALYSWAQTQNIQFTEKQLTDYLSQQLGNSETSLGEFILEANPSMNLLRDAIYIQMIQAALLQSLKDSVVITEDDLKTFYEEQKAKMGKAEIQLRQIVVAEDHEADTLLAALKSGKTTFEAAEKKFSIFRNYKENDELSWIGAKDSSLFTPLENASVGLFPRVLSSHMGFHIVKVVRTRKGAIQSFAALRPSLELAYKEKKGHEVYLQWVHDHVKKETAMIDEQYLLSLTAEYQETF